MKLFILKTDIKSERQLKKLRPLLSTNHRISRWTIDMLDVDRVLRLETKVDEPKSEMIQLVRSHGIDCEELPD